MVAIPSQERDRKERMILGEGRENAGMDRQIQLETLLQKPTHESGNNNIIIIIIITFMNATITL
jgi:hypothetical protein